MERGWWPPKDSLRQVTTPSVNYWKLSHWVSFYFNWDETKWHDTSQSHIPLIPARIAYSISAGLACMSTNLHDPWILGSKLLPFLHRVVFVHSCEQPVLRETNARIQRSPPPAASESGPEAHLAQSTGHLKGPSGVHVGGDDRDTIVVVLGVTEDKLSTEVHLGGGGGGMAVNHIMVVQSQAL